MSRARLRRIASRRQRAERERREEEAAERLRKILDGFLHLADIFNMPAVKSQVEELLKVQQ
jgi:hypothetical protein